MLSVVGGQAYHYTAEAFDPNGSVSYSLEAVDNDGNSITVPTGLAIGSTSGVINWSGADTLAYLTTGNVVHLRVVVMQGGVAATQPYDLAVVAARINNQPPTIDPADNLTVVRNGEFLMTVAGHDPENGALTYSLIEDQANNIPLWTGMAIDNQGRLR